VSARVLAPFGSRSTRIVARRETGGYVVFTALDADGPDPAPGQFYMLRSAGWGSDGGRPFLPRAFSVAAAERTADGVRLDFLVEAVGPGTSILARLSADDGLEITGPLGRPFSDPHEVNPGAPGAIMVGGGIGVAPIAILRRHLTARGVPGRTLLGFRDRAHSGGLELFGACQEVGLAFEDGHRGHQGYVTDLLQVALKGDDAAASAVYACGPPAMLEAVRLICAERGAKAELAMEAPMACGYGACFGCAVPLADGGYMRLCVDGPVVRADELETALVAGSGHR
jgi:NAD(P)H-flavin reductase